MSGLWTSFIAGNGTGAERGDLDGLLARADAGDRDAGERLVELLAEHGDLDGAARVLRTLADAGDRYAAWKLTHLLEKSGDLDGLTGMPPGRWSGCSKSAATWTGQHRYCAPGSMPAMRLPRNNWPGC